MRFVTFYFTSFLLLLLGLNVSAQNVDSSSSDKKLYLVAVNSVPDKCNLPLIGFVNIGKGNHKGAQIGFVNCNRKKFDGAQVGFVNTSGGVTSGAQIGFVNSVSANCKGAQIGFGNFVQRGILVGTQIGFVNMAHKATGAQIGFINFIDSASNAVPYGFLSIVRKGGYMAIEYGFSELYNCNLSFKTGVDAFYTFTTLSFNAGKSNDFGVGSGIGSIIHLGNSFFINPEAMAQIGNVRHQQYYNLCAYAGLTIAQHWQVLAGPSATWQSDRFDNEYSEPVYAFSTIRLNNNNRLLLSGRAAVRYRF